MKAAATTDRVRIFTSGNSQAVRLPKKFRLPGQTARIQRRGRSLVITPDEDAWERFERGVAGLARVMDTFQREQPSGPDRHANLFP
jgi:antitoxin VapB